MIEVVCNDRLGKKVRVKCKYPFSETVQLILKKHVLQHLFHLSPRTANAELARLDN